MDSTFLKNLFAILYKTNFYCEAKYFFCANFSLCFKGYWRGNRKRRIWNWYRKPACLHLRGITNHTSSDKKNTQHGVEKDIVACLSVQSFGELQKSFTDCCYQNCNPSHFFSHRRVSTWAKSEWPGHIVQEPCWASLFNYKTHKSSFSKIAMLKYLQIYTWSWR